MFWLAWVCYSSGTRLILAITDKERGQSGNFNHVHWVVPTLAGVFLSASMLLIFVSFLNCKSSSTDINTSQPRTTEANPRPVLTDLVDTYIMYSASAIAANTVLRSAAGAAAPLFTRQMFSALGIGGGGSLVGGVGALLAVIPFAFYKYGRQIREKSRFAPTTHHTKKRDETDEAEKGTADVTGEGDGAASSDSQSTELEGERREESERDKELRS